jgi:type III restriction enzyme
MNIQLQELEHQKEAIEKIIEAFPQLGKETDFNNNANPILENAGNEKKFIDCKMETGTGKTYVYTRIMLELHQKFGLFKFIIVVPSLAIKEGTRHFINSEYAKRHFNRFFPNKKINLQTINAGDFSAKKGRKNFPLGLMQFCDGNKNETNSIQCLLLSDKGFLDRKDSALFKDDYDQTLFDGISNPSMAIKKCRPIIIIDEPHRMKKDGNTYKNIIEKLEPQMIVRFGATFPETIKGKKDYYREMPIFDLGSVEAFNKDLVKGIDISYPNLPENEAKKVYTIKKLSSNRVIFTKDGKEWEVKANESLAEIDGGIFQTDIEYIGGADKKLSNDLELREGMKFFAGTFSNSYQEILLQQAIDSHFEKEQENFFTENNEPKIKTVSLFFIDSIKSYREQDGWLKITFEKLLDRKLDNLLEKYKTGDYYEYLQATKISLKGESQEIHAGYFAEDKGKGDEAIQKEIDDILNNKEEMLSFRDKNGRWKIRRFLFSKWTLREGWDNPNVFVICKLRTSGSENSKIQEVGRGLRLPVDEAGNRLSNKEFRLNYIIGYDEKDFAEKLINEINSDAKIILNKEKLTAEMIKIICDDRNVTENDLLEILDEKGIVKRNNDFKENGFEKLIEMYPELIQTQLKKYKITSNNKKEKSKIKLRKENWEKIREFWEKISKRYMLGLERLPQNEMENLIEEVLQKDIFNEQPINVIVKKIEKGEILSLSDSQSPKWDTNSNAGQMKYGDFIKTIHKRTFIPISLLHKKIWAKFLEIATNNVNSLLNEISVNNFVHEFKKEFENIFATKYSYYPLDFSAETTVYKNGKFVDDLQQGSVGTNLANISEDKRNLYEGKLLAYDSDIEKDILSISPDSKVIVFGKIPRKAVKIPLYTGGSTTPDFVYAIKKENETQLHLVVESKSEDLRDSEKIAISAQEEVFQKIANVTWKKAIKPSDVENVLKEM